MACLSRSLTHKHKHRGSARSAQYGHRKGETCSPPANLASDGVGEIFTVRTNFIIRSIILWIVKQSNSAEIHRCFGGIFCLYFQGTRISQAICKCKTYSVFALLIAGSQRSKRR
jgi:hypothetical protein